MILLGFAFLTYEEVLLSVLLQDSLETAAAHRIRSGAAALAVLAANRSALAVLLETAGRDCMTKNVST